MSGTKARGGGGRSGGASEGGGGRCVAGGGGEGGVGVILTARGKERAGSRSGVCVEGGEQQEWARRQRQ